MHVAFDLIPLWAVIVISIAIVYCSAEIGYQIATRQKKVSEAKQGSVGSIVGATLGLLAFLLAFTFGLAANRFDAKRMAVLEESNAIGTTYLRAGYLAEPQRTEIRRLLREYVHLRIQPISMDTVEGMLATSNQLQDELWAQAIIVAENNPTSIMAGLFIQTLNEVIDLQAKRVLAALWSRIPTSIWISLSFLTMLAMLAMGYLLGLSNSRNHVVTFTLVLAYTSVVFLIADLDRQAEGLLRVSQQPMIDLWEKIS
jgi:hypothetical protein